MSNEYPLTNLLNQNMDAVREALRAAQARVSELDIKVTDQNSKISSLSGEVQALRKELILMRIANAGTGPTV